MLGIVSLVALRKESVDRNAIMLYDTSSLMVALRKESVDRNVACGCAPSANGASLSARRAWIEIPTIKAMRGDRKGRSPQGERG